MSFLMTFKETATDFSAKEKQSDSESIGSALYDDQHKTLSTQLGLELTFLIYKTDINLMQVMIAGEKILEDKGNEVRYVSPLYVRHVHDFLVGNTVAGDKLKEAFQANLDELNKLYNRDYEVEDFEETFSEIFNAICGFYITVARSEDHGVMISVPR